MRDVTKYWIKLHSSCGYSFIVLHETKTKYIGRKHWAPLLALCKILVWLFAILPVCKPTWGLIACWYICLPVRTKWVLTRLDVWALQRHESRTWARPRTVAGKDTRGAPLGSFLWIAGSLGAWCPVGGMCDTGVVSWVHVNYSCCEVLWKCDEWAEKQGP